MYVSTYVRTPYCGYKIRSQVYTVHTMYGCSEAAVMSGARIVLFCGHDCIPWDLCVQQLAKALSQKDKDETLTEVCGVQYIHIIHESYNK